MIDEGTSRIDSSHLTTSTAKNIFIPITSLKEENLSSPTHSPSSPLPFRDVVHSKKPRNEIALANGHGFKHDDDIFEAFGKYVAHKLRNVENKQSIFAQKFINDVLFEADMGNLGGTFKIINDS